MRTVRLLVPALLVAVLPVIQAAAAPQVSPSFQAGASDAAPRVDGAILRSLVLRGGPAKGLRFSGIALGDGRTVTLDLEPFEVWAPDATIVEHGADGTRRHPVPSDRYFRGTIVDEPGSLVFLVAGNTLRGLIFSGEDVFSIAPEGNVYDPRSAGGDSFVRKVDRERDVPPEFPTFSCSEEELTTPPQQEALAVEPLAGIEPLYTSTVYVASIAIETDFELYSKPTLGSVTSVTQYVGDLVAASSAIYQRDIQVRKTVGILHIASTASDPWTATSTSAALRELGDYWHANYPLASNPRSTVHFLSGKSLGGGIAWIGTICRADFLCSGGSCGSSAYDGHYGGGYGVSAGLSGQFSTSNPSLYWDLLCFSHEVGHNFNSRHTHCYTPAVDTCCPCEPASSSDCTGAVPPEKGTIMSYCHLRPGGYGNIKLYLAVPTESSVAVYNTMRTFVESRTCLPVYSVAPTVTLVSPGQGPTAGGTVVTITGTGFVSGATVTFGGTAATPVVFGSATSITATTPAHAAGPVNVVVTNPDLQSGTLAGGFTYVAPPTVTAVSPSFGPVAGGTSVTITGTNFVATPAVTIGGSNATGEVWVSSTTLTATVPAHAAGLVNVVVTNPDAQAATLTNGYFYAPAPTAALWYPLTPCRVIDTREGNGALAGPVLSASQTRTFDVTTTPATCGIPSDAKSLTVNFTVAESQQPGEFRAWPADAPWTGTSVLSFKAGANRANNGVLKLATDGSGSFKLMNVSSGTAQLILDVNGYFR
jgi:hypothetical protein